MGCHFSKPKEQKQQPHRRPASALPEAEDRRAESAPPTLLPRVGRGRGADIVAVHEQKKKPSVSGGATGHDEFVQVEHEAPAAMPQAEEAALLVAEAVESAAVEVGAALPIAAPEEPAQEPREVTAAAMPEAADESLASTVLDTSGAAVVDEAAAPTAARAREEEPASLQEAVETLQPAQREVAEPGPGLLATLRSTLWTCSACRGEQRRREGERLEEIAMVEVQHGEPGERLEEIGMVEAQHDEPFEVAA